MPTYGYRCPSCATEFEVWQRMTDQPGATCPQCGAAARRVFFPAGIVFKGSGFYATDSRAGSSGGGASSSSTAKDSSKSDTGSSKPEKSERSEKSEKAPSGGSDATSTPAKTS